MLQLGTDLITKTVHKYNLLVTDMLQTCFPVVIILVALCDTVNVLKMATWPRDNMGNVAVFNWSIKLLNKQHETN